MDPLSFTLVIANLQNVQLCCVNFGMFAFSYNQVSTIANYIT